MGSDLDCHLWIRRKVFSLLKLYHYLKRNSKICQDTLYKKEPLNWFQHWSLIPVNTQLQKSLLAEWLLKREPISFCRYFSKNCCMCVTAGIMRIYQYSIRIPQSVWSDLCFWLELNLMMSFRNEDMHLWKHKIWAQKCRKLVFFHFLLCL